MGWAYGVIDGREVGYSVEATCEEPGCEAKIDRGLAYCCGGMHGGGEHACGDYFCDEHLFLAFGPEAPRDPICAACLTALEAEFGTEEEAAEASPQRGSRAT